MFYVKVFSGDLSGEVLSTHAGSDEALAELEEIIQADAEEVMRYGIPDQANAPTYAEALDYSRKFFYIEELG